MRSLACLPVGCNDSGPLSLVADRQRNILVAHDCPDRRGPILQDPELARRLASVPE
jgi:hypothetical protein